MNSIQGNLIGTDKHGTGVLANGASGVFLLEASQNTIGGVPTTGRYSTSPGNVISGNDEDGVLISGSSSQNFVQGNFIGTTASGGAPLGNRLDGVAITAAGALLNTIGGSGGVGPNGAGNVVSGNGQDGVSISRGATENDVQGNAIGTYTSGLTGHGNGRDGVFVYDDADSNLIGGTVTDANTIAYNQGEGVAIGASATDINTVSDSILSNSIFSNGHLGIDLGSDGVTANKPQSPHVGPNLFQSTPVINNAVYIGTGTVIRLLLNSDPTFTFTIQIFASSVPNPMGDYEGEGQTSVTSVNVSTDSHGNIAGGAINVVVPQNLTGQFLTATATDAHGNTSEFAAAFQVI